MGKRDRESFESAKRKADAEQAKLEREKKMAADKAHELRLKKSRSEEEKDRLNREKIEADRKLIEKQRAAARKREEANAYWSYGWGALTGGKDEAEAAARRAQSDEADAAKEIAGNRASIEKRDRDIQYAAAGAQRAETEQHQKDLAA